ncbi:MAG: Tll0287-like domain-containing protein [Nitrospiraceae bacterium]
MSMNVKRRHGPVWWVLAVVVAGGLAGAAKTSPPAHGIPPETVANYVHAVIEADRTIYTRHVVDRMQEKGIVTASENWEGQNTLPLPAQFLIDAARLVGRKENSLRYRLVSLWPIYERNGPATEFERTALEAIQKQPNKPYTGYVESGRRRYFQAVYGDLALAQACIGCHNAHPNSPRRDFKLNDVMGGIVITIPLDH